MRRTRAALEFVAQHAGENAVGFLVQ